MTYADVITLLLCFFAITIVISLPKKEAQRVLSKEIVQEKTSLSQEMVAPRFPVLAREIIVEKDSSLPQTHTPKMQTQPAVVSDADNVSVHDNSTQDAPHIDPVAVLEEKPEAQLENATAIPATLSDIASGAQGLAKLEQKGDRITTLELSSAAFFDIGSANLNKDGTDILRKVATELKDDKYKGYQITVEGHTDDVPIHTAQFPSNWELSTGRASAVVRFFLEQGLLPTNIRAAGYADTFPKAPNRDTNGHALPANQAENRRVVIKLEKIDKNQ
jgi:flagellar motor protein MotB